MQKKIALLHRFPADEITPTNAAFPYLKKRGMDVLTFKKFDRTGKHKKFWKSILWIFYSPFLVLGKGYYTIYCDDSYPIYPALVKMVSPRSKVVIRLGDLHLMYYYSGLAYKILHFLEKIAWIMADEIIVISEVMADYVEQEIGYRPKVVLDPVDPKDFRENGYKDLYAEQTVMFHGTLTRNKNVDILLHAAKCMPETDFIVIGDGPDLKRLQKIAPFNVFFNGWIPFKDIARKISSCAIGVALRSDNPGNEYVVTSPFLQYGAMGKPCLVTRRKVFGDYEWQFSTPGELIEKLKILLDRPEEGKKLQEYVLKNHNAEKIAGEIWEILTQAS